ncbi:hypothetical protein PS627_03528 [Pseudomonas fluorescens]|uniref:hypothetical protein n=1 Tax=Pseudomonas fluorescens TaxID=294 RepID=UPI0012527C1B|nr:hypothetical protein [Pseudomonas fluorescens]CAG8869455.1 hypothetical protein PS627_03528 [Pseudomonas fluorescens]VVP95246.1 hypothetical protein PS910_03276 [Pseudomonas fluorescens]
MTDDKAVLSKDSAALVEDSLIAFGVGMTLLTRSDVKNAFHFASLVAGKLHDPEQESENWYGQFLKVMQDCGWVTTRRNYAREDSSVISASVGSVALRVLGAAGTAALGVAAGQAFGALAQAALAKLGLSPGLKDVFIHKRKGKANGMVGLGACIETAEGEVTLVMSCLAAKAPESENDLLGIEWTVNSSELYTGTAVLSFNKALYEKVRGTVENKLGERSVSNVLEYEV